MLTVDRFRDILQRLLAKSKAGKVRWIEEDVQGPGELYSVPVSADVEVSIFHDSPKGAPDRALATFLIGGRPVARIAAEDGEDDWELLVSLYSDARRCVFRIDAGLDVIEKSLASDGITGAPADSADAPPPDSIPF